MALYTSGTRKHLKETNQPNNAHWTKTYRPSDDVPKSGIYRCVNCGDEVTSNKGDPFPPQNKTQHPCADKIEWQLIVMTQTKG